MSYNAKVYRKQGGDTLVITSSGTLDMDGTMDISGTLGTSGASAAINVETGGTMTIKSGGTLALNSGGALTLPVQTAATSATTLTNNGITTITGTTAGPTFVMASPAAGVFKYIALTATSSGATHRAAIASGTTTIGFSGIAGDKRTQLTLASSAIHAVSLVGVSATEWAIVGVYTSTMGGLDDYTT